MRFDFDEPVDRRGTLSMKWDMVDRAGFDVDPADCLPMWVADSDYRTAPVVREALARYADAGVMAYWGDYGPYHDAIRWWMETRHDWRIGGDEILTTFGVINALALALRAFTDEGDGVVLFTPVYHAFGRIIRQTGRRVVEVPLRVVDGVHRLDMDAARAALTGSERMVIHCSPHNPGGRVWSVEETAAVAAFAEEADLILISDEIHQDLVMPGHRHVPTGRAADAGGRLVTLSSTSKAFNTAGLHSSFAIIGDEGLRRRMEAEIRSAGIGTTAAGIVATTAAFSPDGAAWIDAQAAYLDGNRQRFEAGVDAIPGARAMPLQGTYLAWVDFTGTGMTQDEIEDRVIGRAGIAANKGPTFGTGGEGWMRFNLATQRARVDEAVERLQGAFADLQ